MRRDGETSDAEPAAREALGLEGEDGANDVRLAVHVLAREHVCALRNVTKAQAARGDELATEHHATGTTLAVRAAAHHGLAAERLSQESEKGRVRIGINRDGLAPDDEHLSHAQNPSISKRRRLTGPPGVVSVYLDTRMSLTTYVGALSLLADESRLRLCALLAERELSVTDLVRVTGISQSRVSTHLGRLREGGLVRDRRDGQHAYYALAKDSLPKTAREVLSEAMRTQDPTLAGDQERLSALIAEHRGGLPDAFAGEMERHYSPGRTWQSLSAGLSALLRLGDVLDVGSGDGAVASYLVPYSKSVTCVDTSERMVGAAKDRFADVANVRALLADAHELPFKAASFDAVLVFHTLTYAVRPDRVVAECARVLRPRGRMVVLSLDRHEHKDTTQPYGERHQGFSPQKLRGFFTKAGLVTRTCEVACRESKKPHFRVVRAVAETSEP